ncbi:MAG: hypothetical protein IKG80_00935 [Clostridia bacterium]|nr:hypothetical protein [Clostridia bacterium]
MYKRDELFAFSVLSSSSLRADPDVLHLAKKRLSPFFIKTFDSDLLSAEAEASDLFFENALFCSVCRDGVTVSRCKRQNGKTVFGGFSNLISVYGTGFGRVFAACRDEKEAGEELARALQNSVMILSPDSILIEIKGFEFDEKLGSHIKKALSPNIAVPEIRTFFRDDKRLRSLVLSRLRRLPFKKEGKNK